MLIGLRFVAILVVRRRRARAIAVRLSTVVSAIAPTRLLKLLQHRRASLFARVHTVTLEAGLQFKWRAQTAGRELEETRLLLRLYSALAPGLESQPCLCYSMSNLGF